jgi:hypothetical protein
MFAGFDLAREMKTPGKRVARNWRVPSGEESETFMEKNACGLHNIISP